jgi:AcrR family transcriptional regulator
MEMQTETNRQAHGPVSFREQKKNLTRDMIVRSAIKLFHQKGFESTTVDEIALDAEVSRRTFFRYFPTKELVVFPHQAAYLRLFRSLLAQGPETEPPLTRVRQACLVLAREYMKSRKDHLEQQRIIQASPSLIARGEAFDEDWEAVIARVFAGDSPSPAARRRARFLAGAILGVIRATLKEWYAHGCRDDLVAFGNEALSLIEFGTGSR